jgi:hypothetical protein
MWSKINKRVLYRTTAKWKEGRERRGETDREGGE